MKKIILFACLLSIFIVSSADATLIDRGNGLIYSTILDMTWIQNPTIYGQMTWDQAQSWVSSFSYAGFTDWRFPTVFVDDGQIEKNSEFGRLYHEELGNDWRLSWHEEAYDPGPFTLPYILEFYDCGPGCISYSMSGPDGFWATPVYAKYYSEGFFLNDGTMFVIPEQFKDNAFAGVWAVRDGDVVSVPEPSTSALLIVGILGLFAWRKIYAKQ